MKKSWPCTLPKNGTDARAVAFRDRLSLCVKVEYASKIMVSA